MVATALAERQRTMELLRRSALTPICNCSTDFPCNISIVPRFRSCASPTSDLVEGRQRMTGHSAHFTGERMDQALALSLRYLLPTIGPPHGQREAISTLRRE